MKTEPTLIDLLAIRDGEPVAAERAATVASDLEAQGRLARLREIKEALGRLPNELKPRPGEWEEILLAQEGKGRKSEPQRHTRAMSWPIALVATALIVSATFLFYPLSQDDGVELSRANLVALQDRSRALEGELMESSRYNGSASEQALLFRLADVDTQLTGVNQSDSLSSMRQRELLWQRRVELMEALQVVQQSVEPRPQYAVY